MNTKNKVLIATAFSGGHIFPALAVAGSLEKTLFAKSIFITNAGDFKDQIEKRGHTVVDFGHRRKTYDLVFKLGFDILRTLSIIKKHKPCIVVGFGGGVTLGPLIAAKLLNIPTLVHEQNVRLGRANRLLSIFSQRIALGFSEGKINEAAKKAEKIVLTGNPIREELFIPITKEEAMKSFGFSADKPIILVVGGSQGSHKINISFLKALELLKEIPLQVIHISGNIDYDFVCAQYKILGIAHKVFRFLEDISLAYRIADLVISRAGAMTLSEISLFVIPAILIPYPYSRGHQGDNALFFEDKKAALVINEKSLSAQKLSEAVGCIISNPEKKKIMVDSMRKFARPEATDNLIAQIKEIANV